jgi:hypothetical protein
MSRDVYLVGSVPMANAPEVFAKVSAALGSRLKWLPDGETGERADWITWLEPVFAEHPAFVKSGEFFRIQDHAEDRSGSWTETSLGTLPIEPLRCCTDRRVARAGRTGQDQGRFVIPRGRVVGLPLLYQLRRNGHKTYYASAILLFYGI